MEAQCSVLSCREKRIPPIPLSLVLHPYGKGSTMREGETDLREREREREKEREKRNPPILHSSCPIPIAKGATHHPHRGTDLLIHFTKTVRGAGIVVLVDIMREVLYFIGFLSNVATPLGPPGSFDEMWCLFNTYWCSWRHCVQNS